MVQAWVALVPPSLMLNKWHTRIKTLEENVKLYTQTKLPQEIISGVKEKAEMLSPFHLSTTNLARMLNPYVKNSGEHKNPKFGLSDFSARYPI